MPANASKVTYEISANGEVKMLTRESDRRENLFSQLVGKW